MPIERTCPRCGKAIVTDAFEGLCPTCIGRAAFGSAPALRDGRGIILDLREPALTPEMKAELARLKPEEAGEWIGSYRLMEQLGEGGFGTVWVADQERPVRRRVALKIIKLGMDTREVIARFEQERQALAMMDHPQIAKVFDAGATQWGRPFFVMELVRGSKITEYCDQANLPIEERLPLFMQVCKAVQHAHQKGIIHRDLKPSNILVTIHDGVPVPKVIDFGVAKATQRQRLSDLTIYTQFQQMIGTPLYMSPEQAEMSGLDIDTRSDIYSLGVLLYELLTGRTPFDPEELMKAGIDEVRRVVREQEPKTPSMFLRTMAVETRATVAQHRQVDPAKLTMLVRGDLDWIVMKALEKERSRRYETANAFVEDIQRYRASEPLVARPPSVGYLMHKLVRRHKSAFVAGSAIILALIAGVAVGSWQAAFAAACAVVLTLVAGVGVSSWQAARAMHAERIAEEERAKAVSERDRALMAELRAANAAATAQRALAELKGTAPTLLEVAKSEARLQRFDSALEKIDAALSLDARLLPAYWERAWILLGLEKFAEARDAMRAAQENDPRQGPDTDDLFRIVGKIATAPASERWSGGLGGQLMWHLERLGAYGEIVALAQKLQLGLPEKLALVKSRLNEWFGPNHDHLGWANQAGEIGVDIGRTGVATLEPLRGLPLTWVHANYTWISSLEPLRGMTLMSLRIEMTAVADLSPVKGMQLRDLRCAKTPITDLSPVAGAPLQHVSCYGLQIRDLSPLRSGRLETLVISGMGVSNLDFLAAAPVSSLEADNNNVSDLAPLKGKPLKNLAISMNRISDLTALIGRPIESLSIYGNPLVDLTPLLALPILERLNVGRLGKALEPLRRHGSLKFIGYDGEAERPVSEFWVDFDAEQHRAKT